MKIKSNNNGIKILTTAVGLGLFAGLIEGVMLFGFRQMDLLNWRLYNRAIWYETLWISPLFDIVLFSLVGFLLVLISFNLNKTVTTKLAWITFVHLVIFDWVFILSYGRLSLVTILILTVGISVQILYYVFRCEEKVVRFIKHSLPGLAVLFVALFIVIQGGGWITEKFNVARLSDAQPDSPNVLVIIVDTLRADHLSSYGYYRSTTPFIDSIANEGVQFKNAISSASWTQPSHASILTGRYTYEHQAETKPLDSQFPTIGEVMQLQGYRTGAFSGNTEFFTRRQGFGRGFLHFEDNYHKIEDFGLNTLYGFVFDRFLLRDILNYEGTPGRRLAPDINRSVLNWLSEEDAHPYFVVINYFDVHDPYLPPEPYRSKYASIQNPGGLINGYVERYHPDLTPDQLQSEIDAYDGSISYVDDQIKVLMSELDQHGLLENTIVIVTSDHGESLGEHGLLQHSASLYIQEIHVPLIVWWPKHLPVLSIDTPVTTSALPATILSLINSQDSQFPGPPLSRLIFDPKTSEDWPDPISEVAQFLGAAEQNPTTYGQMKSVFGTEMQYIVHEKFGDELYNWRTDREEENNLVDDSSVGNLLDAFKLYLKDLVGEPIFRKP